MTCNEVAAVFEDCVRRCHKRRSDREPVAMRYRQMKRIAIRLRIHGDEDRFSLSEDAIRALNGLQLLAIEIAINEWWGWPK